MENKNGRKPIAKIMADKELGIGYGTTPADALKLAYEYALKRWCRYPDQRKRFLEAYTCLAADTTGSFPAPRYRNENNEWQYPGQWVLYQKYDPKDNEHTAVIELRVPQLTT